MSVKIIADSCCDLSEVVKNETGVAIVPLSLQIGDKHYTDDEHLDIDRYVGEMKASPVSPKTACPSPQDFINHYQGADTIYCVVLSKELSGTYQSAVIGRDIFLEDHPEVKIHIFNTKSASSGETLVVLKVNELIQQGKSHEEIITEVEAFIEQMETLFLLESLDHLAKSGRLNPIIAKVANILSIKIIAGANEHGTIELEEKVRGYKKAYQRFIEIIQKFGKDFSNRTLVIAHCNCEARAENFKEEVQKRYNFKRVEIVKTRGVASSYADDGGLVIAF